MKAACILLAAGLGKRMNSSTPKVLHRICGTTMLESVIAAVRKLKQDKIVIVAGKHVDLMKKTVGENDLSYVVQSEPKGTGHAVLCAAAALKNFKGDILVLNGDTPLIGPATLKRFLNLHRKRKNFISVLSFIASDPGAYGRIIRDGSGQVCAIIENKDADHGQKAVREVNSGVYAFDSRAFSLLDGIAANPLTGEHYLTDIVSAASGKGRRVTAYPIGSEEEFMGVNTREELRKASEVMKKEILRKLDRKGVNFLDPDSVFIHPEVSIGKETLIYPNVYIEEGTIIGKNSVIYPNARIRNSRIGNSVLIKDSSVIEDSTIKDGAVIGPFAHLRPGSIVGTRARIGNFVEIKKAVIGKDSKASHLSYLGDALIGENVNIGAGTITCNYDGVNKNITTIADGVFVGSDSQLVAPVKIGKGAYIGAGSTITSNVPSGALALSRVRQRNLINWAKKKNPKKDK